MCSLRILCRPTTLSMRGYATKPAYGSASQEQENQFGQGVSHAKGGPSNSKVPEFIQALAPEALEEALPDSPHPTKGDKGESYVTGDSVVPKFRSPWRRYTCIRSPKSVALMAILCRPYLSRSREHFQMRYTIPGLKRRRMTYAGTFLSISFVGVKLTAGATYSRHIAMVTRSHDAATIMLFMFCINLDIFNRK